MTPPRVRAWRAAPHLADWFWTCARYPSATMARGAWEHIDRTRKTGTVEVSRGIDDPGHARGDRRARSSRVEQVANCCARAKTRDMSRLVERMWCRRVVVRATRARPGETGRMRIERPGIAARRSALMASCTSGRRG